MFKKIKNGFFLISFLAFIFLVSRHYFSEQNIIFTNKSRSAYSWSINEDNKNLPILANDTKNIIIYKNDLEEFKNGKMGLIIGGGAWQDKKDKEFVNLVSSCYGSYTFTDLSIFSELALTSQNKKAIISGAKLKKDSFQYGLVIRRIDLDYFALRDNMFRNWNNTDQGEFSLFQELRSRLGSIFINVYSDIFQRLKGKKGEFVKTGNKSGLYLIFKPHHGLQIHTLIKYLFCQTFFALLHQIIDKFGNNQIAINWIR